MDEKKWSRRKRGKRILFVFLCLAVLIGIGIWQQTNIRCLIYLQAMEGSNGEEQRKWARELLELNEPGLSALVSSLKKADNERARSIRTVLEELIQNKATPIEIRRYLGNQLLENFEDAGTLGQCAALQLMTPLLDTTQGDFTTALRLKIGILLKSTEDEIRVQAIGIALRPEINLLSEVLPNLHHPSARVRQGALLALGPQRDGVESLLTDDDLLRFLHDSDPEVREICKMSLKSRGASDLQISLGKQWTHPQPGERLKVLVQFPHDDDFSLAPWLERLLHDPDPAMRAGAIRLASENRINMIPQLETLREKDPDQTVRALAEYYQREMLKQSH